MLASLRLQIPGLRVITTVIDQNGDIIADWRSGPSFVQGRCPA